MIARPEGLLLFALLLSACAHRPDADACVSPASGVRYCLLPPGAIVADAAPRLVEIAAPDGETHLASQLAINDGHLVLTANSLIGQPVFEIHYRQDANGVATVDTRPADAPVRSIWLLAMLQIAQADADAVNRALTGARLESTRQERTIMRDDHVLLKSVQHGNVLEIRVPDQSLRIRITKLNHEPNTQ